MVRIMEWEKRQGEIGHGGWARAWRRGFVLVGAGVPDLRSGDKNMEGAKWASGCECLCCAEGDTKFGIIGEPFDSGCGDMSFEFLKLERLERKRPTRISEEELRETRPWGTVGIGRKRKPNGYFPSEEQEEARATAGSGRAVDSCSTRRKGGSAGPNDAKVNPKSQSGRRFFAT